MCSIVAKILSQIQSPNSFVPVQILAQAKPKEPPTDALPSFTGIYSKLHRVGILSKEQVSGKLIDEWTKSLSTTETKPETTDVSSAISSLLAIKDDEELVSPCIARIYTHSNCYTDRNARALPPTSPRLF